jgi:histidyl-tRNA synthetase
MGPVWRADRPQKGRFREFWQCDADILGSESWACEVEVITALVTAIERLGLAPPRVLMNDRALVHALLDRAGVAEAQRQPTCVILDKQDKVPRDKLVAELVELVGEPVTRLLEGSLMAEQVDRDALRAAAPDAVAKLENIIEALQRLHGRPEGFALAPGLMRGMDYYTGPVFELQHPDFPSSIGSGGRYDGLSGKFGGPAAVPACGGSLGFERLMLLLEERSSGPAVAGPDAVITVFSDELRLQSLELAARLRAAGLNADLYPGTGKLKAQFRYADQKRARYCLVLGPDEAAQGTVKVKEMASGSEATVALADVAAHVGRAQS